MLKRINWKAIFKGFAWLICLAGMVVLMSFISLKKQDVKCKKIEILIPGSDNFIEREEIDAILKQGEGELVGRTLESINIHEIEKTLKANPYIAFAKVYADMDGIIRISIKQRQPILRIINAGGQDYYIDSFGLKMPMSPNFTANVLVANGNILEGFSGKIDTLLTPLAKDLYRTALYAKKDTLWDAQFEQLFVNSKNDIELVPRVGNQRIILGNADSLEIKMNNLLAFYTQAMPKVGWNTYKTINLKYTNQVVCERSDTLAIKNKLPIVKVDTNLLVRKNVDSVVKEAIDLEIKKVAAEVAKPNPKVIKPVTIVKPVIQKEKSTEKIPIKSVETIPAKLPLVKPIVKPAGPTKEKTDTKKNK